MAHVDSMQDTSYELPPEAEARLRALQDEQRARRDLEERDRQARRALWRTHHWPAEYERCTRVGGRHVCRRCVTLYPIALVVMALWLVETPQWPGVVDAVLVWGLCIPATLEFLAEKLTGLPYSSRRQVVVTALVGLALGRGLAHEIADRWSWTFWGPVIAFGSVWFVAALLEAQRKMMEAALSASVEYGPSRTSPQEAAP